MHARSVVFFILKGTTNKYLYAQHISLEFRRNEQTKK